MATENLGLIAVEPFVRRLLHDVDRWFGKREEPFFAVPRTLEAFTWLPDPVPPRTGR